jgi:hypothetical protein
MSKDQGGSKQGKVGKKTSKTSLTDKFIWKHFKQPIIDSKFVIFEKF